MTKTWRQELLDVDGEESRVEKTRRAMTGDKATRRYEDERRWETR